MIDKIVKYNECYGCGACFNQCPHRAISMKQLDLFYYPHVDYSLCVGCKECLRVCPSIHKFQKKVFLPTVFSGRIRDERQLFLSSSGGFFPVLSDYVLDNGGYVCGAVFNNKNGIQHIISNSPHDRDTMKGSKYVQSNLGNCFQIIKTILTSEKKIVLFTGTPCQVHALRLFLGSDGIENLITMDIVCHGVASPVLFVKHVSELERKFGEIQSYNFRDKSMGWRGQNVSIQTTKGKKIVNKKQIKCFVKRYFDSRISRESCYSCGYSSVFRPGDFSAGDFWGIEKTDSAFNDNKGASIIFVNNEKAQKILNSIKDRLFLEKREINEVIQPNLISATKRGVGR